MGVWVLFTEGGLGVHKDAHKQKKVQVQKKKKKCMDSHVKLDIYAHWLIV